MTSLKKCHVKMYVKMFFYGFSKFFKLVLCQANKFKFQVPYPEKKCHGANFPSIP